VGEAQTLSPARRRKSALDPARTSALRRQSKQLAFSRWSGLARTHPPCSGTALTDPCTALSRCRRQEPAQPRRWPRIRRAVSPPRDARIRRTALPICSQSGRLTLIQYRQPVQPATIPAQLFKDAGDVAVGHRPVLLLNSRNGSKLEELVQSFRCMRASEVVGECKLSGRFPRTPIRSSSCCD